MSKIIVIGASAGGLDALKTLLNGLPSGFASSLFLVMHLPVGGNSLVDMLSSAGPLRAEHPLNGAPIEPGRLYVAAADHHLLLSHGHVHVTHGPKDNASRPSVNLLFRSAAQVYGPAVIGVVLSGSTDDGTLGLWDIKKYGGIAVVQDPGEAIFPSMPRSAIENVEVDYVAGAYDLASLLIRLTAESVSAETPTREEEIPEISRSVSGLTCPECRGTLWQIERGHISEFQCRVGHSYTFQTMLEDHAAAQERALWAAAVALEEGALITRQAADEEADPDIARILDLEAEQKDKQAAIIRDLVKQPSGRQKMEHSNPDPRKGVT